MRLCRLTWNYPFNAQIVHTQSELMLYFICQPFNVELIHVWRAAYGTRQWLGSSVNGKSITAVQKNSINMWLIVAAKLLVFFPF